MVWLNIHKLWENGKPTIFSVPHLRSSLPRDTKIIRLRISFRVKTTDIKKHYKLYPRTCVYGSYMLEGVDFTVSYTPVAVTISIHNLIVIASAESLTIFVLDISKSFKSNILPSPKERVYLSLPHIYLKLFQRKCKKQHLSLIN